MPGRGVSAHDEVDEVSKEGRVEAVGGLQPGQQRVGDGLRHQDDADDQPGHGVARQCARGRYWRSQQIRGEQGLQLRLQAPCTLQAQLRRSPAFRASPRPGGRRGAVGPATAARPAPCTRGRFHRGAAVPRRSAAKRAEGGCHHWGSQAVRVRGAVGARRTHTSGRRPPDTWPGATGRASQGGPEPTLQQRRPWPLLGQTPAQAVQLGEVGAAPATRRGSWTQAPFPSMRLMQLGSGSDPMGTVGSACQPFSGPEGQPAARAGPACRLLSEHQGTAPSCPEGPPRHCALGVPLVTVSARPEPGYPSRCTQGWGLGPGAWGLGAGAWGLGRPCVCGGRVRYGPS